MNDPGRTVLLIEDNPGDARLIREMLTEVPTSGFRLEWVDRLARGLDRLGTSGIGVVLLDLSLPDSQGLATFQAVRSTAPLTPIVVLSGLTDEELALTAVREGAQDYLVKGRVDGELLARALGYAIERQQLIVDNTRLFQQAQDAIRLRDTVLSSVSHDLRNPLAAIRIIVDTLKLQLANGDAAAEPALLTEGLTQIDTSAIRLDNQIQELLDVARLQMGQQLALKRRSMDLVALARAAVTDYQRRTRRHCIHLEAGGESLVGRWDQARIERVLANLLSNAVKYSLDGGEIIVRLRADGHGEHRWAVLEVQDHGVGIPAAELPRVFSWYYRGGNVADRVSGNGIGLAGAHQIVEQHGGRLEVASQEGLGSTFTVRLPLASSEA